MATRRRRFNIETRRTIARSAELCRHVEKQSRAGQFEGSEKLLKELTKSTKLLIKHLGFGDPKSLDMVYCLGGDGRIVTGVGDRGFENGCKASAGFKSACQLVGGRVRGGCMT
ncbi:MAG: hypothetical protein HYX90_06300 [Chloroflexi bacterium]|nr:hypothetical protein [Chloroflexota bacterium]